VGAAVLEGSPLLLRVAPEHKALAEQLDRMWPARVQILHKSQGVPLPRPIKGVLFWRLPDMRIIQRFFSH
jgi:hypothetical protein